MAIPEKYVPTADTDVVHVMMSDLEMLARTLIWIAGNHDSHCRQCRVTNEVILEALRVLVHLDEKS